MGYDPDQREYARQQIVAQRAIQAPSWFTQQQQRDQQNVSLARTLFNPTVTRATGLGSYMDDPVVQTVDSVMRIGGVNYFNYRLQTLFNDWVAIMGRQAAPSLIVDLARSPVDLADAQKALKAMANTWSAYRNVLLPSGGLGLDQQMARYLERGVPVRPSLAVLHDPDYRAGVYADAVDQEVKNTLEGKQRYDPLTTGPAPLNPDDNAILRDPRFSHIAASQIQAIKESRTLYGYKDNGYLRMTDTLMGMNLVENLINVTAPRTEEEAVSEELAGVGVLYAMGMYDLREWDNKYHNKDDLNAAILEHYRRNYSRGGRVGRAFAFKRGENIAPTTGEILHYSGLETVLKALGWYDAQKGKAGIFLSEAIKAEQEIRQMRPVGKGYARKAPGPGFWEPEAQEILEEAWNTAKQTYAEGGSIGSYLIAEAGLDPAEHPILTWTAEFAYQTGVDSLLWAGVSTGARVIKIPEAVNYALTHSGTVQSVAEVIARTNSPRIISKLTDITDPRVLTKLKYADTAEKVTAALGSHIVEAGGIRGTEVMAWRRMRTAMMEATDAGGGIPLPQIVSRMFQVFGERTLAMHDDEVLRSFEQVGRATRRPLDEINRFTDEAIEAEDHASRVGIMARWMDEIAKEDKDKYDSLVEYWGKQAPEIKVKESGQTYTPFPWATNEAELHDIYKVMSDAKYNYLARAHRAINREMLVLQRQLQLKEYRLPGDPLRPDGLPDLRYPELRRAGLLEDEITAVIEGKMSPEQAADAIRARGARTPDFDIGGNVTGATTEMPIPSNVEKVLDEALGYTFDRDAVDGVAWFTSEAGATAGGYDYVIEGAELVVKHLNVIEDYRNYGIGTRLISDIAKLAKGQNLGLRFELGEGWTEALGKLGIPEVMGKAALSPDEVAELASTSARRELSKRVKDAAQAGTGAGRKDTEMYLEDLRRRSSVELTVRELNNHIETVLRPQAEEIDSYVKSILDANSASEGLLKWLRAYVKRAGLINLHGTDFGIDEGGRAIQKASHNLAHRVDPGTTVIRGGRQVTKKSQARMGPSIDSIATEVAALPEAKMLNITDTESFWEWLRNYRPLNKKELRAKAEDLILFDDVDRARELADSREILAHYAQEMEKAGLDARLARATLARLDEMQTRQSAGDLIEIDIFKRAAEQQKDLLDIPLDETQKLRQLQNRSRGLEEIMAKMENASKDMEGKISAPAMPYQLAQYYVPPAPLHVMAAHWSGGPVKWLDRMQRASVRVGSEQHHIHMNLDLITSWWKKYLLAAPATMLKIATDEPLRMLVEGYPLTDVFLGPWNHGKSLRWIRALNENPELKEAGEFAARIFTEESWLPRISYLYEMAQPGVFHARFGNMPGWSTAAQHFFGVMAKQPPMKAWLAEGRPGLERWIRTDTGKAHLERASGAATEDNMKAWVDAQEEWFTELTHYPVRTVDRPLGQLSPEELAAHQNWERMGAGAPRTRGVTPLPAGYSGGAAKASDFDALRAEIETWPDVKRGARPSARTQALEAVDNAKALEENFTYPTAAFEPQTVYVVRGPDGKVVGVTRLDRGYVGTSLSDTVYQGRDLRDMAALDMAIHPDYQGTDVVKHLSEWTVEEARKKGVGIQYERDLGRRGAGTKRTKEHYLSAEEVQKLTTIPAEPAPIALKTGESIKYGRVVAPNDVVMDMLMGTRRISTKELEKLPMEMRPVISAPKPRVYATFGEKSTTKLGKAKEVVTTNPVNHVYNLFDGVFRNTRHTVYARELDKRYQMLEEMAYAALERGGKGTQGKIPDPQVIWREAEKFARAKVESMTYNATRTGFESALRDIVPFMPATRDFMMYWGKQAVQKPPLGLALMRLQDMPDEMIVPTPDDLMTTVGQAFSRFSTWVDELGGAGEVALKPLAWAASLLEVPLDVIPNVKWYVNPRTMFFFTGGASPTSTGGEDTGFLKFMREQFPGFGPFITMPAEWLYETFPDTFGWIPQFPGLERAGQHLPLNSRFERAWYAGTGLVKSLGTGGIKNFIVNGKLTGGDWRGTTLWGLFGRDQDARDRYTIEFIRAISMVFDIDWSGKQYSREDVAKKLGVDLTTMSAEAELNGRQQMVAEEIYQAATEFQGKENLVAATMNLFLPGTMWLRDRELEEMNKAFDDYVRTYETPTAYQEKVSGASDLEGAAARGKVRQSAPEYAPFYDYFDALQRRDSEAMERIAMEEPGVLSFFVSAYNKSMNAASAGKMAAEGIAADSWQAFQWMRENEISEGVPRATVLLPNVFAEDLVKKQMDRVSFEQYQTKRAAFETDVAAQAKAAGLDLDTYKRTPEYELLKDKFTREVEDLKSTPYYQLPPKGFHEVMSNVLTEERKRERATNLMAAREHELENALGSNWKNREVDPLYKTIMGNYEQIAREEGITLTPPAKTLEEIQHTELVQWVNAAPERFWKPDWEDHGLGQWDEGFPAVRDQWASVRNEVYKKMKQIGADWDDDDMATIRQGYYSFVTQLCDDSPSFSRFWDYYQKQDWERLRDSGKLKSPAWQELFGALAERDTNLRMGVYVTRSKTGKVVSTAVNFNFNTPAKAVREARDQLIYMVEMWQMEDPMFAREFDQFGYNFFNFERRW